MDKYIIDGVEYCQGEEVEVLDSKTGVWLLDILQGVDSSQVRKFLCVSGHWEFIRKLQPTLSGRKAKLTLDDGTEYSVVVE